jgi:hypothetical protein
VLERDASSVVEPVHGEDQAQNGDLVEIFDGFARVAVAGGLAASERLAPTDDL